MKNLLKISILILSIIGLNSCVDDEMYVGPATIVNVAGLPLAPSSTETVTVTAKVTDLKGLKTVKLYYKTAAESTFTAIDMAASEKFIYTATLPAFPKDTTVQYYVEAINENNLTVYYPAKAPTSFISYKVGASTLVKLFINEAFADGTKDSTNPDWVEIYNDSDIEVNLNGYAFYDDGIKTSNGTKAKRILGDIKVPSKGFVAIPTEYNGETVTFGLSTSGDAVFLDDPSGVLVTSLDFNGINLSGKKSYGRKPDASTTYVTFVNPTKAASNNNAD